MNSRPRAAAILLGFLLVFASATTFDAQQAQPNHTLTFAELTYGTGITAIAADGHGGAWFGADTCDPRLPTTPGAVKPEIPYTGCHGLLGRTTANGAVTYLSYIGGDQGPDHVRALAVDSLGDVYVGGSTYSPDFPTTPDAYDRVCGDDGTCTILKFVGDAGQSMVVPVSDGFLMKLSPAGDRLLYSTYIGGRDEDGVASIALGANGIHLAGSTMSDDFPVTAGALQSAYAFGTNPNGDVLDDAFYTRLSTDGTQLQYATYLGGHDNDWGTGVALDVAGNAFVVGTTTSLDFPVQNPARPTNTSPTGYPNITADAFLARFGSSGAVYSTYVGGSQTDTATGVATVDGGVYLTGEVCSPDFPLVSDPYVAQCEAYAATLWATDGSVGRMITLHSRGGSDSGNAIAVDGSHHAYITGVTTNYGTAFPTTPDAYQRAPGGGGADAFAAIVDMQPLTPALLYSTYLGGNDDEQGTALALDGNGGAFFGGSSRLYPGAASTFPSHTTQTQPPAEPAPNVLQSFTAHIAATSPTANGDESNLVLYARDASVAGSWQLVADVTAAGGTRAWLPDAGVAKLSSASASPANYIDLTFQAPAGVPYQLWLRMKADQDSWQNDSVFVQFSDSLNASGTPAWRIGTTSATIVSLEDCTGCGEQGWGWNDNGYATAGTLVTFASGGTHTIRIQQREDGISVDQIVLSPTEFLTSAPGANKNDTTIFAASPAPDTTEIVKYAIDAAVTGNWQFVEDGTAAAGARLWNPEWGVAKLASASAAPANYFDVTFNAQAGVPYHLWLRMTAQNDSWTNDSVFVQFSDSVDGSGNPVWRIGSNGATVVSLEDCSGCGEQGWGWNDNGYGTAGTAVIFATSGPHTIRIQQREDGISVDQIVLSAAKYLNQPPGAAKNDATIVSR